MVVTTTTMTNCSECPAGSGVTKACNNHHNDTATAMEDTQCEPCQAGSTFSDSASRHLACRTCRTCPPNSRVKRECNVTHDTECECDKDHYQELVAMMTTTPEEVETTTPHARHKHGHQQAVLTCKPCDLCPHGYGAARACSATHNTVCRKCPTSTYSSVLSSSAGCSVCTVCRDDQVTLHECTPIQDTVCAGTSTLQKKIIE